jgi:hypothetical protein
MTLRKALEFVEPDQLRGSGGRGTARQTHDSFSLRREPETDSQLAADNIDGLLHRLAGGSLQEIDKVAAELAKWIADLQDLHEQLRKEYARVQRDVSEYANVSQSAMQSTKIITESLRYWNKIDLNAAGAGEHDVDAGKLRSLAAPSCPPERSGLRTAG